VKQFHPHAAHTAERVAAALAPHVHGRVLELASGSGQQCCVFAARMPDVTWQPSELDAGALTSIEAYRADSGCANLLPPLALDVRRPWPVDHIDVVLAIRLLHVLAEIQCVFEGARAVGAASVIVIGPIAEMASPAPAMPAHLAAWTVPIRIPTRAEVTAHGFAITHEEALGDDVMLVLGPAARGSGTTSGSRAG